MVRFGGGEVVLTKENTKWICNANLGVSMIVWVAKHREGDCEDLGHLFWIDS